MINAVTLPGAGLSLATEIAEVFGEHLRQKGMNEEWIDMLVSRYDKTVQWAETPVRVRSNEGIRIYISL
jgi:hypothetical protein